MTIKVRFAPSPTGHLHIGGLRAALFNYYFAKQNNGQFVIRIEDTDHERNKEEYTKAILDSFDWCDIKSDEEIVYQSKRNHIYQKYINILLHSGAAYYSEEKDEEGNISKVIKCKVEKFFSHITFHDIIRGNISFPITEFDDFIIVRSDGSPLYNLVVVIDDIEMKISHIIRGEEHLPNTPKQIILYQAFKAKIPFFAHLPLILGTDRKKLSKRDAATAVIDYKNEGIFSEALCMYLLRLGWAYKDQEIFTKEEIFKYFKLEDIHLSGAIFDNQKLLSINQYYIKKKSNEDLYKAMIVLFAESKEYLFDENKDKKIIALYKERISTLKELAMICNHIKKNPHYQIISYEEKKIFNHIITLFIHYFKEDQTINNIISLIEKIDNYKKHEIYTALRYAILGKLESPSILKIIDIFSKEELLVRLENLINALK